MLTRRKFAVLAGACVAGGWDAKASPYGQGSVRVPGFSVMLWTLNKLGTPEENLQRVAAAGYQHVELVDEYQKWSAEDWARVVPKMQALGISVDAMAGVAGGFADPHGTEAYLASLERVIPSAQRLGCKQIILLSGNRIDGVEQQVQHAAAVGTLQRAAVLLHAAGMEGVIEPIDRLENPRMYLDGVTEAFAITRAVGSAHVKVLYDLYHEQRGLGNLIEKLDGNVDQVGLIHVADVPGRHEPGTGEVDFCNVYRALARLQYRGVIAMEFNPSGEAVDTLRKAREEALRCLSGV